MWRLTGALRASGAAAPEKITECEEISKKLKFMIKFNQFCCKDLPDAAKRYMLDTEYGVVSELPTGVR